VFRTAKTSPSTRCGDCDKLAPELDQSDQHQMKAIQGARNSPVRMDALRDRDCHRHERARAMRHDRMFAISRKITRDLSRRVHSELMLTILWKFSGQCFRGF
jgi:hypothetical protein